MSNTNETKITKDPSGKKLIVTRDFNAPLANVWRAWTDSSLLDAWWAPKPWKAETKSMDFKEGGAWLYAMMGPKGEKQWCRMDYQTIDPKKAFTAMDAFCDEQGKPSGDFPVTHWDTQFASTGNGTHVTVVLTFDSEADLEKLIESGFKEGFTMAHGNLDALLAQ